jgi:hypothetical protein
MNSRIESVAIDLTAAHKRAADWLFLLHYTFRNGEQSGMQARSPTQFLGSSEELKKATYQCCPYHLGQHALGRCVVRSANSSLHRSACCINGARIDSPPISGTPAPKQPQIFGCQSLDRGLCDGLRYAATFTDHETHSSAADRVFLDCRGALASPSVVPAAREPSPWRWS